MGYKIYISDLLPYKIIFFDLEKCWLDSDEFIKQYKDKYNKLKDFYTILRFKYISKTYVSNCRLLLEIIILHTRRINEANIALNNTFIKSPICYDIRNTIFDIYKLEWSTHLDNITELFKENEINSNILEESTISKLKDHLNYLQTL